MKRCIVLLFFFLSVSVFGQDSADTLKPWKFTGLGSLSITQASFTNWSAGGENSIAGLALVKVYADYTKGKFSNNNSLTLKYGIQQNESYNQPRKNDDLIDFNSQVNHKMSKNWSISALLNFNTQFTNGYNYPDNSPVISKFMAPAYLTFSPGILYKPVDYFTILITPITAKGIFVLDQDLADLGAFGVDKADTLNDGSVDKGTGKTSKIKLGAFTEIYFKKSFKSNVTFESKLNLFYNYLNDNNIPEGTAPIDFHWQNFLLLRINKWFAASFFAHLAYMPGDVFIERKGLTDPITTKPNDKLQIKQSFGIGLTYSLTNGK